MTWMTIEQFFAAMEKPKCKHCDKKATWIADKQSPAYCDDCYNQRFGDIKLSDETPSANSSSAASDPTTEH